MRPHRYIYTKDYRRVLSRRDKDDRVRDRKVIGWTLLMTALPLVYMAFVDLPPLLAVLLLTLGLFGLMQGVTYIYHAIGLYSQRDAMIQFMLPETRQEADRLLADVPIQSLDVHRYEESELGGRRLFTFWGEDPDRWIRTAPREVKETELQSKLFYRELREEKGTRLPDGDLLKMPPGVYAVSASLNPKDRRAPDESFDRSSDKKME